MTQEQPRERMHAPKVQEVLAMAEEWPMPLEGCKMYYRKIQDLPSGRYSAELCEKLGSLDLDDISPNKDAVAILLGLLYLRCGGVDEAHDIVTPYSWASPEGFATGPPVRNSTAAQDACYAHAMVHRREGEHVGEFGTGWNNSSYWFGTVGAHPVYSQVYERAYELSRGNSELQHHMQAHGGAWQPRKFLKLCEEGVRSKDKAVADFCREVANTEWRCLFDYCYSKPT